ncbi:MAG: cation:dicarboxylase symporter family transporter, partial [Clostridia bacterium]|nr:cation:dicarboxylase symporter family transporter [Clostridia bacterium]
GEALLMSIYGFPPSAYPIIVTIGFLIDAPATMINSVGDTVAAMLVARFVEGKDWMKKKLTRHPAAATLAGEADMAESV